MGLSGTVARTASRHAHVLVVEAPGSWRTRVAAEVSLTARGWRVASSPADADVLVVCGEPGPGLASAVEVVWQQMPGPRVRVQVHGRDQVEARLDDAHHRLLDTDGHRHDARQRPSAGDVLADRADPAEGHDRHEHPDPTSAGDHDGMDHGDMDHGDMDHGDMEMSPGGIPLAEGGADRDGLEMDVLRVRWGPVLRHWPAGLVLRCSLQGDVIVEAEAELLDGRDGQGDDLAHPARRIDGISSLLALAGWDDAAAEARRIRDIALDPAYAGLGTELQRLRRRVRRARLLRWSLRGLGRVGDEEAHDLGLPAVAVGDVHDRLLSMVDRAVADAAQPVVDGTGDGNRGARPTLSGNNLARLVLGLDLAAARLVIASLDVEELLTGEAMNEASHG